ncbi:Uncharacterised protein [uncultured archaeon]|nr:Uncharacterised protein [uncultured archaeon]
MKCRRSEGTRDMVEGKLWSFALYGKGTEVNGMPRLEVRPLAKT